MKKIPDGLIASQAVIGLPVFSIKEGQNVGIVRKVLVNGKNKPLFLVEDEEWFKGGKVVGGPSVTKIGKEALLIEGKDKLVAFNDPSIDDISKCHCFKDMTAIKGDQALGKIREFAIERDKLEIVDIEVVTGDRDDKRVYFSIEEVADVTDQEVIIKESKQANGSDSAEATLDKEEVELEGLIKEEPESDSALSDETSVKLDEATPDSAKATPDKVPDKEEKVTPTDLSKKAPNGNGEVEEVAAPKEKPKDKPKEISEEPAVTEASVAHKDLKQILEERQDKFLMGKKVDRDITADDGTIIIKKGETITKEVLEEAKKAHKYIVLSFCIKTDLIKKS